MKTLAKLALATSVLAGAAIATTTVADARVFVGIGVGGPGYYYGPPAYPRYSCDPYSRWYDPYYCRRYYDDDDDYGPAYYGPSYYGPAFSFGWSGGGHHWGHDHDHWGGHGHWH